jgi:hypothetical protein
MKKLLAMMLALVLVCSAVPAVFATEPEETTEATEATEIVRAPDECGEGITWEYKDGILFIRGDGAMDDFEDGKTPWQSHKDRIEEVLIEGKLTYIGAYAFKDFDNLLAVDFGDALYEIGTEAFRGCDGLNAIWLPRSFKIFGEGSFQSCKNLKEIHCSGRFPSFRQNSMWDTYVTIYYPADNPWGEETIRQLEEAFKGRVKFLASDGTDPYAPTEPETVPEETVPETTVPETTVPETEEPTESLPIMTQPPETEEVTEPETEPETQEQTEPSQATEPEEEERDEKNGIPTGLIIAAAVLAGVALGFVLFGRKKGKYQR